MSGAPGEESRGSEWKPKKASHIRGRVDGAEHWECTGVDEAEEEAFT